MSLSVDDRLSAADRWLAAELGGQNVPPLLVFIGLGDAGLLSLIGQRAPAAKVLVIEPTPEIGAAFLKHADAQRWRAAGRLAYLIDPDYAGADEAWRVFPSDPDAHKLIVRPDVARDGGPAAIRAARIYKQILFGARANAEARRRFAPGYLAGTLHNLPAIVAGQDVRALENAYRGIPAVIAAAGPSLDAVIDDLGSVRERAVLFAADTALRPLRTSGLSPQFAVAVDPQPLNARHFHELPPCPDTWLVSETSIDPSVIAPFGSRAFWFRVSHHEPWSWYNEIGIDVGRVDVWGSVITAAFQIAVYSGCDPIVFVGADLAFTGDRPYCRGTTYEFDWAYLVANGQTRDEAWRAFLRVDEQVRIPDVHGRETATTPSLQSFRDWLVGRARRSGRRVVNATGAGILVGDGIEQRALTDVLTAKRRIPSPQDVKRRSPTTASRADVARRLWEVHRTVCRNAQSTPPLDRWREFCGDGFDLAAVGDAIESAARVLDHSDAGLEPARTTIPWATIGSTGASHALISRLPESIGRFRAALTGGYVGQTFRSADMENNCLLDALSILRSIGDVASTRSDLAAIRAEQLGRVPLGASEAWPVELGRAVRLFEGLLGEAWPAAPLPPPVESSFFSRHVVRRRDDKTVGAPKGAGASRSGLAPLTLLALEWWLCARFSRAGSSARPHVAAQWRALVDKVITPLDDDAGGAPMTLSLDVGARPAMELPLPVGSHALARVLTGAPLMTPRVLTDEGVARAVLPYSTGATAVCTVLRGCESLVVDENGSTSPGHAWPRAINGELPFGDDGVVAWSVGPDASWPNGGSGYVMYRPTADAKPIVESLPFAPQTGLWWRGRAYWVCFPFGVGSWAPGSAPEFALPDRTLFAAIDDGDALVLNPRARTAQGAAERRLITDGWRWQPQQEPQPFALGPLGAASSRAIAHGWTATAYPEADAIVLQREDGVSVTMTCYYPFGLAWAGRSLLVSTADGELLLFERLTDVLADSVGGSR